VKLFREFMAGEPGQKSRRKGPAKISPKSWSIS
jgi:hypothetical protein